LEVLNIFRTDLHWASPVWFGLLPVWVYLYFHWRRGRRKKVYPLPAAGEVRLRPSPKKIFFSLSGLVWLLGLTGLTLAMARPQTVKRYQEYKGEGIEIVLALDVSPSMLSLDFRPNRLEVAKKLAAEFVKKRFGDKIGLTVFSGEAYSKCPLTTDYRTLTKLIQELTPGHLQTGTAIGMGLATAINQLKNGKAKSRIVILLTDGSNNSGSIHPLEAAQIAKTLGIKVYTIGIGSGGIVNMPVRKLANGEYIFAPVPSDFDEDLLRQMAQLTGAKYFRAKNAAQLKQIYAIIDKLEKSKIEVIVHQNKIERYRPFLIFGLSMFVLYAMMMLLWVRPLTE